MTNSNHKRRTRSDKFPLTLHKTGLYCKKIKGSPPDQLPDSSTQTPPNDTDDQDVARLQREIRSMGHEFKLVQAEYGKNMLNLMVVIG